MKIAELTVFHVRIPLRKPIRHASHSRTDTDNVLVRCVLDDRTEGWGEGVPRDYVTGETVDSALALLKRSDLAARRRVAPISPAAVAFAERLRLADVAGDDRGIQGNAARCAVELAVLDAYGRRFGAPVSEATRLLAPDLYRPRPEVRYSGAITSSKGFKLRLSAWAMRLYGFRQLKVKVGIAGQDDVDRLRSIRKRVGAGMDLSASTPTRRGRPPRPPNGFGRWSRSGSVPWSSRRRTPSWRRWRRSAGRCGRR